MNQLQEISNSYFVLVVWVTNCFNLGAIQCSPLKNLRVLESLSNGQACDFSGILVFKNFMKGPIQQLLVEIQQWKHQNNVQNMFKANSKETRTTLMTWFWCLYCCKLWTYSTNCFRLSIVDFEQVNARQDVSWYKNKK